MKQLSKICFAVLLIIIPFLNSCDAMLDVESERYTFEEDARLSSIHDTLYSMVGVLSKMQALGDRYVLLGELRGDLMKVTDNSTTEMKDIYQFNVSKDNSYASMNAYYSVINQCNYILQYADTAYEQKSDKPYMRVYTAAKSIRAWTYMQMMLNYNTVPYSGEAVLSIQDTQKDFPVFDRATMIDTLIADLLPLVEEDNMNLGYFGSYNSQYSIFPVKLLLGDLYLLKNDYANAADMYYRLIYEKSLIISGSYNNYWSESNGVIVESGAFIDWHNAFSVSGRELVNVLATYPKYGNTFTLDSMSMRKQIMPSDLAIQKWLGATYYLNESSTKAGDMRMFNTINDYYSISLLSSYFSSLISINTYDPIISKYSYMNDNITEDDAQILVLYRSAMVYLRFAEAINRLGYPQTAFAVMKYGLNSTTLAKPEIVSEWYRVDTAYTPSYLSSFAFARFDNNVGTRQRGCGNVQNDNTFFIIPDSTTMVSSGYCANGDNVPTKQDTILYVEDMIMEECALELAFEGNRFHDLMRVALRRNDPAYLADKVAAKYPADKQAEMKAKLMNESNWYLPQ